MAIFEEIALKLLCTAVPDGSSFVIAGVGRVTGDVMGPPEIIITVWVTPSSPTDEAVTTEGCSVVAGDTMVVYTWLYT